MDDITISDTTEFIPHGLSVYTTEQTAALIKVKPPTIRSCKSKNKDKLRENYHWAKGGDNDTWWTEMGVEKLSQLIPSAQRYTARITPPQRPALQSTTPDITALEQIALTPSQRAKLDPDVEHMARGVYANGVAQLVRERVAQLIDNPTPEQSEWKQSLSNAYAGLLGFGALTSGLQAAVQASKASLKAEGE